MGGKIGKPKKKFYSDEISKKNSKAELKEAYTSKVSKELSAPNINQGNGVPNGSVSMQKQHRWDASDSREGPGTSDAYNSVFKRNDAITALFDFEARSGKELGFKQHDRLVVIRLEDEDWIYARHEETGKSGYIPVNYVAHAESLEVFDWYFGSINRREAENILLREQEGTFLIRDSFSNPGDFALSLRNYDKDRNTHVKHYVIKFSNYKYSIWNRAHFSTLNDLIEDYKVRTHGLPMLLRRPCPKYQPTMYELSIETKDEWEIDRKEIQLLKLIGSGNFGEVYYGKWRNKIDVAIKTLKKGSMPDDQFLEEASIMKDLKHENILSLLATCSKEEPIYIITQFMANGSLLSLLRKKKHDESFSYDQMLEFAFQISKGMLYLEKRKLVHRDLAARNVLVDNRLTCKIADFGLAKIIESEEHKISDGKIPIKWSPPEVLCGGTFSIKSDVWSFGVVMIEIFTYGDVLYQGMNRRQIQAKVLSGYRLPQPPLCPDVIYELLLKCWDQNPAGRPYFKDLSAYLDDSCHKVNDGTQYLRDFEAFGH